MSMCRIPFTGACINTGQMHVHRHGHREVVGLMDGAPAGNRRVLGLARRRMLDHG